MGLVDLECELFDMKRAMAHLDLEMKAYRAALRDQIDASVLLEPMLNNINKLISSAEEAKQKVDRGLRSPVAAEG